MSPYDRIWDAKVSPQPLARITLCLVGTEDRDNKDSFLKIDRTAISELRGEAASVVIGHRVAAWRLVAGSAESVINTRGFNRGKNKMIESLRIRTSKTLVTILALGCMCPHSARAQIGPSYVEERLGAFWRMTDPLRKPGPPDASRLQLAADAETFLKTAFASYPDYLAYGLASLTHFYGYCNDRPNAERTIGAAVALVDTPGQHNPDSLLAVEVEYATFLDWTQRHDLALAHLKAAAAIPSTWDPQSLATQATLAWLGALMRQHGAAAEASSLLKGVTKSPTDYGGHLWPYWQERRAIWRDSMSQVGNELGIPDDANWSTRLHEVEQQLRDDFHSYPYEREQSALELALLLSTNGRIPDAEQLIDEVNRDLGSRRSSFPDLDIELSLLESPAAMNKGQFTQSYLDLSHALQVAQQTFTPDSMFAPPLLIRIATLFVTSGQIDEGLLLAQRLAYEYEANSSNPEIFFQAEIVLALAYSNQKQFDLADQELRRALRYAQALPEPQKPTVSGPITPEQVAATDKMERGLRIGKYHRPAMIALVEHYLQDNDASAHDLQRWIEDVTAGLAVIRDGFGEASTDYLNALDSIAISGRNVFGEKYAQPYAQQLKEILLKTQPIDQGRLVRAELLLQPDHFSLTSATIPQIRIELNQTPVSSPIHAGLEAVLGDTLIRQGKLDEGMSHLATVQQWQNSGRFEGKSALEILSAERGVDRGPLDVLEMSLLDAADLQHGPGKRAAMLQAFQTAQVTQSLYKTSLSLTKLEPRESTKGPELFTLIRRFEQKSATVGRNERSLITAIAVESPQLQDASLSTQDAGKDLAQLAERIHDLARNFDAATRIPIVPVKQLQQALAADQVLVLLSVGGEYLLSDSRWRNGATFVVDRNDVKVVPLCTGQENCQPDTLMKAFSKYVAYVTPDGGRAGKRNQTHHSAPSDGLAAAQQIYHSIWRAVDNTIATLGHPVHHVIIVTDRFLNAVPFASLVAKSDRDGPHWLIEKYAVSYLPTVDAIISGNRDARTGPLRFVGIGDISNARYQPPLPESANEICELASEIEGATAPRGSQGKLDTTDRDLDRCRKNADQSNGRVHIMLKGEATKEALLALSQQHVLESADVLAFATHGVLVGANSSEPGLALSTSAGDPEGALGITDISSLVVGADLVILSACSTADSPGLGTEVREMPTVAAAFIQSGAHSILGTFTAVDTYAAREITTKSVSRWLSNKQAGMARALQEQMLEETHARHPPSYWAPFVYFGAR